MQVDSSRLGLAQKVILADLRTSVARQLMCTGLASRMKPEFQELARTVRAEVVGSRAVGQAVRNIDVSKVPLVERLQRAYKSHGAMVECDDAGAYKYHVQGGTREMAAPVARELMSYATNLADRQTRYTTAIKIRREAEGKMADRSAGALPDKMLAYSSAKLNEMTTQSAYHEGVRQFLVNRASLATRGYDVSEADARVQSDRSLQRFLRDTQEVLKLVESGLRKPAPARNPGL